MGKVMWKKEEGLGSQFPYHIYLIGFMGSGKTAVSTQLAKLCSMEAIEMDRMISEREGMGIPEIFDRYGEGYFRSLETKLLEELQGKGHAVVSCGGGTPMRKENVERMRQSGKIVLLSAEPETIYARVKDSHDRPLLEGNMNIPYISGLMEQRRERYEKAADLILHTDGKGIKEICMEIMQRLHK